MNDIYRTESREERAEKNFFSLLSAKRSLFSLLSSLSIAVSLLFFSSCQTVKPYQRMYLNDNDMALKLRKIEGYESNIHAYREGAAGANGGKAGGGCGCN